MNQDDFSMFEPSDGEMKYDYPELADVDEFRELNNNELKFVWYFAASSSPIKNLANKPRAKKAVSLAYGRFKTKESVKQLMECNFPDDIETAIKVMRSYRMAYRIKAKLAQEYIFDRMLEIVQLNDETPVENMDFEERKKYTDVAQKVSSHLPELLRNVEYSFGLTDKAGKKKTKTPIPKISELQDLI